MLHDWHFSFGYFAARTLYFYWSQTLLATEHVNTVVLVLLLRHSFHLWTLLSDFRCTWSHGFFHTQTGNLHPQWRQLCCTAGKPSEFFTFILDSNISIRELEYISNKCRNSYQTKADLVRLHVMRLWRAADGCDAGGGEASQGGSSSFRTNMAAPEGVSGCY